MHQMSVHQRALPRGAERSEKVLQLPKGRLFQQPAPASERAPSSRHRTGEKPRRRTPSPQTIESCPLENSISRYRVRTPGVPRIAPNQASGCEPAAMAGAVFFDRPFCVLGTSRIKAAVIAQPGTEYELVYTDQEQKQFAHQRLPLNSFSSSCRARSISPGVAARRSLTT